MPSDNAFHIAVFAGDGIGTEVTEPALQLLREVADKVGGLDYEFEMLPAGAQAYLDTGKALPPTSVQRTREADAILLSAMGDPTVRYSDGTELVPQIELRFELDLFAGYRPIKSIPGVAGPLSDPRAQNIDFVLIRESIEGLFAPDRVGTKDDNEATETLLITRAISEKLFDATFDLAQRRKAAGTSGRVTCVDKANVFGAFAFFRDIFDAKATQHGSKQADHAYVDAMSMYMVNRPWDYDVMVTENMFGDILSDLGAALIGGMGYAPSADIGDQHAVFQPCHGSAPDIAGQGLANPTAMFLSAAMMLEWLGRKHTSKEAALASSAIRLAVDNAFAKGALKTCELGGNSGLKDVYAAVSGALAELDLSEASQFTSTVSL